jgi:hypothetical protein
MQEEFRDVLGYEGLYQVSNLGNVKSLARMAKHYKGGEKIIYEKILKKRIGKDRYFHVGLYKDGISKTKKVHKLVAIAFLDHKPCGMNKVVDHINDNSFDNRLENLQLITNRENVYKTQGKYSSKYKGVNWSKSNKKWTVRIRIKNERKFLGYFDCELSAHLAYQNKLKEII